MEPSAGQLLPHAVIDLASRRSKGLTIERHLKIGMRKQPNRAIEVGIGSRGNAHCFGTRSRPVCDLDAANGHVRCLISDGYRFMHANLRGLTQTNQAW